MKQLITFCYLISCCLFSYSQNVGIGTTTPHASAALEIKDSTKGILIPRMTMAQRNAIQNPEEGLMVYQTDSTKGFWYWDGDFWKLVNSKLSNENSSVGNHMISFNPGIYSWIVPNGINSVIIEMWGGGGGGGRAYQVGAAQNPAFSGAGGGYGKCSLSVTPNDTMIIVVGIGGIGGMPNGGNGGITSFNELIFATGGEGGSLGNTVPTGGTSNAAINVAGTNGNYGTCRGGGAGGISGGPNYGFGNGGGVGCSNYTSSGGAGSNGALILIY